MPAESPQQPASESVLRRLVRAEAAVTIVTGGQTGVDTYAAHAALRAGLPVHVVFPLGFRQEDGALTAGRRRSLRGARLYGLPDPSFRYRTWTCVYLSDAVLLVDPAGGAGCRETARAARHLGRPLLEPEISALTPSLAANWLAATGARVILVAGCRASLLAIEGRGKGLRAGLAAFMRGARAVQDELSVTNGD